MRPHAPLCLLAAAALACASPRRSAEPAAKESPMTEIAESYVKLILAMGMVEEGYVDAYYGPPEWRASVEAAKPSPAQIREGATTLLARVRALPPATDELGRQRQRFIALHLTALLARLDMKEGKRLRFDEESRALYDAVAPVVPESRFEEVQAEMARVLPGAGPLIGRVDELRNALIIPREKLDAVFSAAIAECRARTLRHIELPAGESFTVEYVTGKPWGAYNWYQGGYRSIIQVNTDLPVFLDRAIDLACHEGYPGHHVQGLLLEKRMVREHGATEMTVWPLYSPMSLIGEGAANHGIDLAFSAEERTDFERRVLAPLAGLDGGKVATYAKVSKLTRELKHVTNQAARRYLDGEIDAAAAAAYLTRYALMQPEHARKRVTFIDSVRSYVINYNLGQDLVAAWVDKAPPGPARWAAFEELISSPMTAGDLQ